MKSIVAVFVVQRDVDHGGRRRGATAKTIPKAANRTPRRRARARGTGYFGAKRLNGTGASTVWPVASCTRAARRMLATP